MIDRVKRTLIATLLLALCVTLALCIAGCESDTATKAPEDDAASVQATSSSSQKEGSTTEKGEYPAGVYRIGEDIPAGGYTFTRDADEEFLMVYVWDDFSTDDPNEAVVNEWFTEEEAFVSVADGQVLKVQGGTFSSVG